MSTVWIPAHERVQAMARVQTSIQPMGKAVAAARDATFLASLAARPSPRFRRHDGCIRRGSQAGPRHGPASKEPRRETGP
jgi:hypothetical protein